MGKRHAHGFRIRRAVQIDVAAECIDLAQPVAAGFASADPENSSQDPVAAGKPSMQLRGPDLTRPASTAEYGAFRKALTDTRPNLVTTTRRTTGTIEFARPVQRGGYRQANAQPAGPEAIELLVGK